MIASPVLVLSAQHGNQQLAKLLLHKFQLLSCILESAPTPDMHNASNISMCSTVLSAVLQLNRHIIIHVGGFPTLGVPCWGVPTERIEVFGVLLGSPYFGNYNPYIYPIIVVSIFFSIIPYITPIYTL